MAHLRITTKDIVLAYGYADINDDPNNNYLKSGSSFETKSSKIQQQNRPRSSPIIDQLFAKWRKTNVKIVQFRKW